MLALGAALLPLGAWPQLTALGAVIVLLAAMARIGPGPFLARLVPPLGFVLLVSVALLFLAPGETVARLGPLRITDLGLLRFGSAIGRGAVGLGAAVLLVSTTPFPELVRALQELRLPAAVTTSLGLAYRYLYILTDEIERLRRAARSRNAGSGSTARRRLVLGMTSAALQRSFQRSERVHQAMLSRGYTGRMPTLETHAHHGRPGVELALLAALVTTLLLTAYL